jgi:hypothetical protein
MNTKVYMYKVSFIDLDCTEHYHVTDKFAVALGYYRAYRDMGFCPVITRDGKVLNHI